MEDLAPGDESQDDWWSDDTELTNALKTCMGTLPEKSRSILDWRYRERDATEIAARLGTTSTAVRATLKRVRVSLWQCIRGRYRDRRRAGIASSAEPPILRSRTKTASPSVNNSVNFVNSV